MSNDKIQAVGVNIAEKATMIWNVADMLRGPFKPHEYGLSTTVCFPPTKQSWHSMKRSRSWLSLMAF